MTTNDIDAIRELERTILPGPWRVGELTPTGPDLWQLPILLDRKGPDGPDTIEVCAVEYETQGFQYPHDDARRDAAFIAAARTHVPALCDELDRVRADLAAAQLDADELRADLRAADELTDENLRLREQVFAQKPVIEAAQAWAEMCDDADVDNPRKVEDALHGAIESYQLMDLALTSARAENAEVAK